MLNNLKNVDEHLKKQMVILGWMLIFLGGLFIIYISKPVIFFIFRALTPFILALILAYIFDPIVSFVQKRLRLPRVTGLIVFYIIIILLITLFLLLILPEAFRQGANMISSVKNGIPKQIDLLQSKYGIEINKETINRIIEKLNIGEEQIKDAAGAIAPGIKNIAGTGVTAAGNIAKGIAGALGQVFSTFSVLMFVIIINFYFLIDFDKIKPTFEKFIPPDNLPKARELMNKVDRAVGGFLRGQAIDCFIIGILTMIGLFILGLGKYAVLIGVAAGMGNAIPYLGPLIGGIPSVLFILLSDSYSTMNERLWYIGGVVLLFGVIQTIDGLLFQPKIVGKNSQLHPLAVLFALFFGAQFGFAGIIIAIPLACIARVLIIELVLPRISYSHAETIKNKKAKQN